MAWLLGRGPLLSSSHGREWPGCCFDLRGVTRTRKITLVRRDQGASAGPHKTTVCPLVAE